MATRKSPSESYETDSTNGCEVEEFELIQRLRALLRARGTPGILICANDHADAKEQLGVVGEILGIIVRDMP